MKIEIFTATIPGRCYSCFLLIISVDEYTCETPANLVTRKLFIISRILLVKPERR